MVQTIFTNDTTALDSTDKASLFEIATQCPWIGGRAVYQARNMMERFDTTYIDYADWCENNDSSELRFEEKDYSKKKNTVTGSISVYPNPVDENINIKYTGVKDDSWFVLYDMVGRETDRIRLNGEQGIKQYDTDKLNNGLYIYKAKGILKGRSIEGKIIIAK